MNSEQPKRFYEAKFGAETEFAILPGENPVEFELLHTRLAEEWVPDGPLEDDAVYTMAKCIWRKRRYQRFNAARNTAAKFDPDHEAYDEQESLTVFRRLLLQQTNDEGVIQLLSRLGGHLADYLRDKSPRRNFKTVKAWIKAMRHETLKLLSQG